MIKIDKKILGVAALTAITIATMALWPSSSDAAKCDNMQTLKKQLKDGSTQVVAYTCGKGICDKILKMDMASGGYHAKKILFCE